MGPGQGTYRMCPRLPGGAAGARAPCHPPHSGHSWGPLSSLAGLHCLGPLPSRGSETWGAAAKRQLGRSGFSESPRRRADPPQSHSRRPLHGNPFPRSPDLRQVCLAPPLCPEGPASCQALGLPSTCGQASRRHGPGGRGHSPSPPSAARLLDIDAAACCLVAPAVQPNPVLEHAPAGSTGPPATPLLGFSIVCGGRPWPSSSGSVRGARSGPPRAQRRPRGGGLPSDLRTGQD